MSKYFLHGKLKASSGNGEKLAAILIEASKLVSRSSTCQLYLVSKDPDQPETIWITEVWDNKEAHDASLQNPAVRALIGQAVPILDGMPEGGQALEILGGYGI